MQNTNRMDIVWATDENYVFLTGVSMVSVFENNKSSKQIKVWILADRLSKKSIDQLTKCAHMYGRDIEFLDMGEYISKVKRIGAKRWGVNRSFSVYSWIFIADVMKQYGVPKIMYCDCDLIIDGSLQEVWNFSLGGYPGNGERV